MIGLNEPTSCNKNSQMKWNDRNETKQNENHRAHWRECDGQCYKLIYRYPNLKTMLTYSIENFANSDLIGIFALTPLRKVNSIIISGAIWINWHMAVKIATKHALCCQYAILSKSQQMIKLFLNFCALSRSRHTVFKPEQTSNHKHISLIAVPTK